jgi:hypothetical protein
MLDDVMVRRLDKGRVLFACDFNSPELPGVLKVDRGSWHHVPKGGPDGSGCMETEGQLVMVTLGVPVDRLPLLVAYRRANVYARGLKHNWASFAMWKSYESAVLFHGLGRIVSYAKPSREGAVTPWETTREYICDDYIVRFHNSAFHDLMIIRRAKGSPLQLMVRSPHRIDDLRIRSIRPEEVPDVSRYLRAIDAIPPEKRKGTVVLSNLKPGPSYKQVAAQFCEGNTD